MGSLGPLQYIIDLEVEPRCVRLELLLWKKVIQAPLNPLSRYSEENEVSRTCLTWRQKVATCEEDNEAVSCYDHEVFVHSPQFLHEHCASLALCHASYLVLPYT